MRKTLLFVIALAMSVGGLVLLGIELLSANIIQFKFVIGGALLATLGIYLLWADFVAPILGITEKE
jgi:hypothetical protein